MNEKALVYLWVGLGSALGGMGRYWLASLVSRMGGTGFPWGTLAVNVSGCFLMGIFAALAGPDPRTASLRLTHFFMVGICGGYTTFSAFSLQTFQLLREAHGWLAFGNVLLSVILCVIAVWVGFGAGQGLHR